MSKQGLTYNGKPCKLGHSGVRYASSGGCVECAREAALKRAKERRQAKAAEEPAHAVGG